VGSSGDFDLRNRIDLNNKCAKCYFSDFDHIVLQ
jgi:hypothetical protein